MLGDQMPTKENAEKLEDTRPGTDTDGEVFEKWWTVECANMVVSSEKELAKAAFDAGWKAHEKEAETKYRELKGCQYCGAIVGYKNSPGWVNEFDKRNSE